MANFIVCQSKRNHIVESQAKPKTSRQVPTHLLKFYEEDVIEWGSNRRRAIKEWSIAINSDWVYN